MLQMRRNLANSVDLASGGLAHVGQALSRRMSDLAGLFLDRDRALELASGDNPLIYQVFMPESEESDPSALLYGTTVIQPGKVGDEYHMTKGHFHADGQSPEVYLGLRGRGWILLMDRSGAASTLPLEPGSVAYIPPETAHRTVNIGAEPLVFFAVWPESAGHDYESIARHGFSQRILERQGQPAMVPDPHWRQP